MTITMEQYDELGSYLEHKGFSDDAIDGYFLEHHGVKGMKWGSRRALQINAKRAAQGKRPVKASQHVGNKATRGAAYVVSYMLGSAIGSTVGGAASGGNILVSSLGAAAGSIAGVVATNKALKSVGNKRMTELD